MSVDARVGAEREQAHASRKVTHRCEPGHHASSARPATGMAVVDDHAARGLSLR